MPEIQEFVMLSEKELDRIETLVQNLLKITKLDVGSIVLEKTLENVPDMMKVVPIPSSLSTSIVPLCSSTIIFVRDSHKPIPCVSVENRLR